MFLLGTGVWAKRKVMVMQERSSDEEWRKPITVYQGDHTNGLPMPIRCTSVEVQGVAFKDFHDDESDEVCYYGGDDWDDERNGGGENDCGDAVEMIERASVVIILLDGGVDDGVHGDINIPAFPFLMNCTTAPPIW